MFQIKNNPTLKMLKFSSSTKLPIYFFFYTDFIYVQRIKEHYPLNKACEGLVNLINFRIVI